MTRLPNAEIYLVPLGSGRFELYSEPSDDANPASSTDGFLRRHVHRFSAWWDETVRRGRETSESDSSVRRWRDRFICRTAELIAEQRTVWALRGHAEAMLVYPADLSERAAHAARARVLTIARRRHVIWLIVDGIIFAASGVLVLVPGPNVIAYYFGFRVVMHYLSWRGARQGLERIAWNARPEPALAELGRLVDEPRAARASRVEAIASGLNLPRLAAFFERAAVPVRG